MIVDNILAGTYISTAGLTKKLAYRDLQEVGRKFVKTLKTRVFINKPLSTETAYQQDLINRDLLSTSLIVGKVGPGM